MAISAASYAVGNPVYRGGSFAPTMGTVDPMGYVERSLNQPSDARSGLAEAALRRMSSMGANTPVGLGGPTPSAAKGNSNPDMPALNLSALSNVMGQPAPPDFPIIPTVRDAVRARMGPDGTYRLDVRQLQEQVAHAHDYASAAQRALSAMQPIPSVPSMPNGGMSNAQ